MGSHYEKGLSLVELMISLAIGSLITAGIVQLYTANSATYGLVLGQSRMQESARFALAFISRDVQRAGYRGCFSSNSQLHWTISNPANLPYEFDLRSGLEGYNGTAGGNWSPSLNAIPASSQGFVAGTGIDRSSIVSGTDVLTLRNIVQQTVENRLSVPMPTSREPIEIVAPPGGVGGLGFNDGDLALIHDCEKATIFHVAGSLPGSGIDTATAAPNYLINHSLAPTVSWRNDFLTLAVKNTFGTDAAVSGIETHTYFIAPGNAQNAGGIVPLSLWRKSGTSVPIELVEGIEDLQVLFGVSTTGDTVPNQYLSANLVADWTAVTTVRVTVVANTVEDVGVNSSDGLIRRAFTQTIMLRNSG